MSKSKELEATHTVDLSEFTAKKADDNETDKKYCLKLIPRDPTKRAYLLQANSEEEMNNWIQVLKNSSALGVRRGVQDTTDKNDSGTTGLNSYISHLLSLEGNGNCVDCFTPISGTSGEGGWFIKNLGIFVCVNCAGLHRQLPVQVSRTRSLVMDKVEYTDLILIKSLGNVRSNAIYEFALPVLKKPTSQTDLPQRKLFIESKYVKREYFAKPDIDLTRSTPLSPEEMLIQAIRERRLEQIVKVAGLGATINGPQLSNEETLPLHLCVKQDYMCALVYLLENGALINQQDNNGNTCLHYAAQSNNPDILWVLLKYGAVPTIKNSNNQAPLDLCLQGSQCHNYLIKTISGSKMDDPPADQFLRNWDDIGSEEIETSRSRRSFLEATQPVPGSGSGFQPQSSQSNLSSNSSEDASKTTATTRPGMISPSSSSSSLPTSSIAKKEPPQLPSLPPKTAAAAAGSTPTPMKKEPPPLPSQPPSKRDTIAPPLASPISTEATSTNTSSAVSSPQVAPRPVAPPRRKPSEMSLTTPPSPVLPTTTATATTSTATTSTTATTTTTTPTPTSQQPQPSAVRASSYMGQTQAPDTSRKFKPMSFYPNQDGQNAIASELNAKLLRQRSNELSEETSERKEEKKEESYQRAKALYDCDPERPDEIAFKEGDVILIVQKKEDGWWRGKLEGTEKIGLLPSNYVELL